MVAHNCYYCNEQGAEICTKKIKPKILKNAADIEGKKCPEEYWENCTKKECDDNCNEAAPWQQWICYCEGVKKKIQLKIDSLKVEVTTSCPESEEGSCTPDSICVHMKEILTTSAPVSELVLALIIIVCITVFLIIIAAVLVILLTWI